MTEKATNYPPLPETTTDDEVLNYSQRVRRGFVDNILENGYPEDIKTQSMMLSALDSMDRAALTKKRLNSDDANAEADRQAAVLISKVAAQLGGRDPFAVEQPVERVLEVDDTELPAVSLAPGETEIGLSNLTYEDFSKQYGKEAKG